MRVKLCKGEKELDFFMASILPRHGAIVVTYGHDKWNHSINLYRIYYHLLPTEIPLDLEHE